MLNETYRAMLGHKSVIRETFMYGKQRAAEIGYENVFDYSLGNPSVPCPDKFTKAMQTLLAEEEPVALHGYCPSQGDPGFRTAVAAHLAKTFGLPYEQKDIFPTTGAAGAIAHAIRAVTKPGDEVLTFAPYFPEYGRSKKAGEELFFAYAQETGAKVAVYRFVNLMGHSRPKYNSAVSTFCWAVANDEPFTVNDRSTELELLYIDDLVEGMFDLLEGKEQHCEFDGVETVLKEDGRYCCVPVTHKVTLGEIVDLLQQFKAQPTTLMMPKMPDGSFAKKLYSLYLTYLPTDKFKYALKMNMDNRGSFTELVHTADCGQVSINISRPGITKGQHWHNSKWELFIVVAGHGLIQERNINTGETVEFEVSGDEIEAVHMIPGWTHNIINLSETENLVTVMTCNEIFDPKHPDTFFEPV